MRDILIREKSKCAIAPLLTAAIWLSFALAYRGNAPDTELRLPAWSQKKEIQKYSLAEALEIAKGGEPITELALDDRVEKLLSEFWRLSGLEILDLSDCSLTELSAPIGRLSGLKELYVENNRLKQVPAEIGQLTRLKVLSLGNNYLTDLPDKISRLTDLEELNLEGNLIENIATGIGQLKRLKIGTSLKPDWSACRPRSAG